MAENYKVDNVDLKILEILMHDAKKPYTEVAKKAFVSGGTVHVRMNKLEEAGIVEKTTLKVNYAKLGYDITAFIANNTRIRFILEGGYTGTEFFFVDDVRITDGEKTAGHWELRGDMSSSVTSGGRGAGRGFAARRPAAVRQVG